RHEGRLMSKKRRGGVEDPRYELYYEFTTSLERTRPHQVLAIRRGEKDKVLSAGIEADADGLIAWIKRRKNTVQHPTARRLLHETIEDSYGRLLHPSIERDLRGELEDVADKHAIGVFTVNLKHLLLQPP